MSKLIKHLPVLGIGMFVLLYIYAARLYPGGSVVDSHSIGYDWFHNYWCDLMYKHSLDGSRNLARPTAILAWIILCLSILYVLIIIIRKLFKPGRVRMILLFTAVLAMSFGLLASTDKHDLFVLLSFPFGAVIVIILALQAQRLKTNLLRIMSWFVVLSLTSSFIMYFTSLGLYWIGFIQKIALTLSFIWIIRFYYFTIDENELMLQ